MVHSLCKRSRVSFIFALLSVGVVFLNGCGDDASGTYSDPSLFCVPDCIDGQTCINAVCVENERICGDIVCAQGYVCGDGACVPAERICGDMVCDQGYVCGDGACVPAERICGDIICQDGTFCNEGQCTPLDPCSGKVCGEGYECSAGECVPVDLCKDKNCPPGQECLGGKCLDSACIVGGEEKTCEEGKMCVAGDCVDDGCIVDGEMMICAEGWTCIKGICEEIACLDKVCGEGRTCTGGECVDNECLEMTCDTGFVCAKGDCVLEACVDVECPQTKVCQADGTCAFMSPPALSVLQGENSSTGENGDTASIQVVLTEQPSADVVVSCLTEDDTEGAADCHITFTAENWNIAQTITVSGVDDYDIDGDQPWNLALSTTSEDAEFNGLSAKASFINLDNDRALVVIGKSDGMMTSEDGASVQFTLALSAKPASDVTVTFASDDSSEGITDVTSVVFTPENWNIPQTVTVTGVDDNIEEPNGTEYHIVFEKTQSEDSNFAGLEIPPMTIVNQDNDVAGITVTGPSGGLVTDELGASQTIGLALNTQPEAPVTIRVSINKPGEAVSDVEQIIITPENWKNIHNLVISGVADHIIDGDQSYIVTLSVSSDDENYKLADIVLNGTNQDSDKAGFSIESGGTMTVTEAGSTASFKVSLLSKPTSDVSLALTSLDTTELAIVTSSLTFAPDTWNVPQQVTVAGVDDFEDDGDIDTKVRIVSSSSDSNFEGLTNENMVFRTIDDDTASILVTGSAAMLPENGGSSEFGVVLKAKPSKPVNIKLTSSDITELTTGVSILTFDSSNWNVAQTVTVKAVDDNQTDGNQTATISLNSTSDDVLFDGLSGVSPVYTIQDDESAGITVSASATVLDPDNPTAVLSVSLSAQPTDTVTVTIVTSNDNAAHPSTTTITFTPENWNTPQSVTISSPDLTEAVSTAVISTSSVSDCEAYDNQSGTDIHLTVYGFKQAEFSAAETCGSQSIEMLPGKYLLEVWGASGGDGVGNNQNLGSHGGLGGYSRGEITLTAKTTLYVMVGTKGSAGKSGKYGSTAVGGGCGGGGGGGIASSNGSIGYGGGGGTDIRVGSDTLNHRVIVAGGGGGADNGEGTLNGSDDGSGGYGGGNNGGNGKTDGVLSSALAGATQTSGNAFGVGGSCMHEYDIGGGGGGWYGGKSAATTGNHGGGGGSGFVFTSSSAENCPADYALTATYYLVNAQTIAGNATFTSPSGSEETGHAGDGFARITLAE